MSYEQFIEQLKERYEQYIEEALTSNISGIVYANAWDRFYLLRKETEHQIWLRESNFEGVWHRLEISASYSTEETGRFSKGDEEAWNALLKEFHRLKFKKDQLVLRAAKTTVPLGLSAQETELSLLNEWRNEILTESTPLKDKFFSFFGTLVPEEVRSSSEAASRADHYRDVLELMKRDRKIPPSEESHDSR